MYAPPQQPIQSKVYFAEDSLAMLSEEADKLLKLVRELEDEILTGYTANILRPSLTMFLPSDEDFSRR
jgi:hypothetical protein